MSAKANGLPVAARHAVPLRDTELGPLPEDWQVVRLGEVLSEVDIRYKDLEKVDQELPVLSLTKNDGLILQTERFGKRIATEDVSEYKVVLRGQIVNNPYVIWEGAVHALSKYNAGLVSPVYPVWEVKSDKADFLFVDPLLRMPAAIAVYNRFASGAVNRRRAIRKSDFLSVPIPLPPIAEQRAIAHVLRTVQEAKEATERVIAALRDLKRSLMNHLFTYGPVPIGVGAQRAVPLRETEIGPIPEHWQVVRLGEVMERPQYGYTASASVFPIGPKFLRITDIQSGKVIWSSVPFCEITQSEIEKYTLKPGDILVARIGATTGKTFLVDECPPAIFASYLIRIRILSDENLLPDFLSFFTDTRTYWDQINSSKGGRLKLGINIPVLQNLLIPLPPIAEQREIARILQAVDRRIQAEEAYARALGDLFKTLLHELMTARRRLPPAFVAGFEAHEDA